ncbi:hypothetical protein [Anaeromyxobacter oryzae]|uniref:Uncharacterized protein n=1 Tax=Anaeromyxobacter oryzae TaxID=2918170 RepID=A0ABN6MX23_9BACT|nr:hypothetical protein [Anaeromyxobacter oryzae]BDG05522.1 hypothetical protein AMOR_45180 [Anaeromyxobacter oryzae]
MVYVGFSTPRRWNPLSALIRAMTHSRTSHAWLLVEDPVFQLRLVLEAHTTGFRLVSLTRFVKDNKVVALVTPDPSHPLDEGLPAAGEWLGAKFDVLGLFGIFLTLLARWFRQRPWRNPFPTPSALFCSEAVVRVLKEAHYPGSAALGDETTTPAGLLEWLRASGSCVLERDDLQLWRSMKPHRRVMRPLAEGAPPAEPGAASPERPRSVA